jgi:signal transduction histidine kinase
MALAALCHLTATVSRSPDLQQILQDSMDLVVHQVVRTEAGVIIFLLDEQTGEMAVAAHHGVPADHPCLVKGLLGECLCGLAAKSGQVISSRNGSRDDRHVCRWPGMHPHQDLSLPLKARDQVLGVLHLHLTPHREITAGDHQLLGALTGQLSLAIDNARLAAAVQEQGEQLWGLRARLVEAEEAERQRLTRELHDQVGQSLSVLGLNLNLVQSLLSRGSGDKINSYLAESIALVHQTVDMIRDLMAQLRPPLLDNFGLLAALRWYGLLLARRAGIIVRIVGCEPTPRLPISVELPLFRIAQEALTNVAKHAQISQVTVTQEVEGDLVRLVIADSGVGFHLPDLGRFLDRPHWGLMTMKERAAAVGGHCRIESCPGAGTRVVVEVPR